MVENGTRIFYIGGSDMNYCYGSYDTPTFRKWWLLKTMGVKQYDLSNRKSVITGNILESMILDEAGVPNTARTKEATRIAIGDTGIGVNLDGHQKGEFVHEAKTGMIMHYSGLKTSTGGDQILGKKLGIGYRRQVFHGCWVAQCPVAMIHFMPVTEDDYANPLSADISGRLMSFELPVWEEFNADEHSIRMHYLSQCMKLRADPSNVELKRRLVLDRRDALLYAQRYFDKDRVYG